MIETVLIMWLFGYHWGDWTLPFKIATPLLHTMFSAAQVWGTKNYWCMWKQHEKMLREDMEDLETGEKEQEC